MNTRGRQSESAGFTERSEETTSPEELCGPSASSASLKLHRAAAAAAAVAAADAGHLQPRSWTAASELLKRRSNLLHRLCVRL